MNQQSNLTNQNRDSQKEIKIVKETNYSYQVNPVEKMITQRKVKSRKGEGRIQLAKRVNRKTNNVEMKFEVSDKRKKQMR
ncbi:Oidioi.mRNA.OKI2018_I69.chr1.g3855.t1.cds [Oikopleura dioica]|uniref:Oidioi.mRNA.OKI2018_I69.chr1.g3855.t1.cds n=1 Tax=Oikopleura dioica TaxID=34765 RepID=A0ABN7SX54_OIKDI|nr:Oidioi.mRNA.OKI2018_I69.chr1.g3855.t1.cds [Oikopleura dioica]